MPASVQTEQPTFELDELRLEPGLVVVVGRWSGVRGMRFVRPTLTVAGRRVLATLEHEPWAPDAGAPWTAAFPWDGGDVDPAQASLAVAPSVTVGLAGGTARPEPEAADPVAAERVRFERRETEVEFLRGELRRVAAERDRALARRDEAVRDLRHERPRRGLTTLDLYAFRFFGVIAAVCFIVLLVSLARVFV